MTNFLPSRLTEASFRRYEDIIATAVDNYPQETSFSIPEGIAPNTFIARIRDAVLSVKKFAWTTKIDMKKLWELSNITVWSLDAANKCVWFREKQTRGRPNELTSLAKTHNAAEISASHWSSWINAEVSAACVLISGGKLAGPIVLEGEIDPTLTDALTQIHDVGFYYDSEKNETILT